MSKELRRDRHRVSLPSGHIVFAPKYRGKILAGDVVMVAEGIICNACREMDIEIQDLDYANNDMYRHWT